ncbi:hypothetical protein F4781DRAFT_436526 [Annulohypoxylon bovei var. microspora]|nr:hypothetical protein F4781DRAFT_436526 [Annulohypoxylon bovei var. microspora]
MQVLCVGFPHCGTESLRNALLALGYDHTYHLPGMGPGEVNYFPRWIRLYRKKWFGVLDSNCTIMRAVLGHTVAVVGAAGAVFAADLIAAYPEAKVVLNRDIDAWHRRMKHGQAPEGVLEDLIEVMS